MPELYKAERSKTNTKYYLIIPTSYLLENYRATSFPFCYTSLIVSCYNFPVRDFFKYVIQNFDAEIGIDKEYPYFQLRFLSKRTAEKFCNELNERAHERIAL